MMASEELSKYLTFFYISFFIGVVLEFLDFFLLMSSSFIIENEEILIWDIFFNSGNVSFYRTLSWIIILVLNCIYFGIGLIFFGLKHKKEIKPLVLAKFIIILGIFVLVNSFTHLEYLVVVANTPIPLDSGSILFKEIVWDSHYSSFILLAFWVFLYAITSLYLIFGLFITAGGINWSNKIAKVNEQSAA
ncbi:MAG: hypothetical protein ACTSU4_03525 [Promethearchaeota archaeon]